MLRVRQPEPRDLLHGLVRKRARPLVRAEPGRRVSEHRATHRATPVDAPSFSRPGRPDGRRPSLIPQRSPRGARSRPDSAWLLVVALGVLLASVVVLTPARARAGAPQSREGPDLTKRARATGPSFYCCAVLPARSLRGRPARSSSSGNKRPRLDAGAFATTPDVVATVRRVVVQSRQRSPRSSFKMDQWTLRTRDLPGLILRTDVGEGRAAPTLPWRPGHRG